MGEQSNLSIGHSPGDEPGKTKTVNAESSNAWYVNMNNGNVNNNNKNNNNKYVRPVLAYLIENIIRTEPEFLSPR